jgi:N-acetylglutamate synthase-like GNAT family acetyltransferase
LQRIPNLNWEPSPTRSKNIIGRLHLSKATDVDAIEVSKALVKTLDSAHFPSTHGFTRLQIVKLETQKDFKKKA